MTLPAVGERAPDFSLPSDDGSTVSLAELAGQVVVLYFYPKDDTPGCTTEACDFRDNLERLRELGATVIGVSGDGAGSHERFRAKYDLNFPLLSDEDHAMMERFGVWQKKKQYGKEYFGVVRTTFLIDGDGIVRQVWSPVRVHTKNKQGEVSRRHVDQVAQALEALRAG